MMRPRLPHRTGRRTAPRARVIGVRAPAVAVAACALVLIGSGAVAAAADADDAAGSTRADSRAWSPFFAVERPVPVVDSRHVIVRFADPSLGEWERAGTKKFTAAQRAAWVKRALVRQQQRLDAIAKSGVQFRIEHRYIRVVNGVSIVLHGDAGQLLRSIEGVEQVTAVRTLWPTAAAAADAAGSAGAAAAAGAGPASAVRSAATRVAILDAGVDASHPAVRGAVATPFDATRSETPQTQGAQPAKVEITADAHGTAIAGAVLSGAAAQRDEVELMPVRILERRPTRDGDEALLGDSDDLLAGLEHAVDPNADGDLADGADVAVVASTTPFAGFTDSIEEHAVAGATGLGTLVVAAAGNDGASGDDVGTIGSVAAATDALSVGAVDLRAKTPSVDVRVQGDGIDESFPDLASLAAGDAKLPTGETMIVSIDAAGDDVTHYLDGELRSRVTGRAVLLATRDGVEVARQVRAAADAGAVAVIIAARGTKAAAGTIDAPGVDIPAIGMTRADARDIRTALADGAVLTATFAAGTQKNSSFGQVAGFSSAGPRLDGTGRPDVVAPGVGMLVAGADAGWATMSGTSIASAWAAGAAAAVRVQHPEWDVATVHAMLLATARPLGSVGERPPVEAQGAGVLDADVAARSAWRAGSGRIDFGAIAPGTSARRALGLAGAPGSAAAAAGTGDVKILLDDGGRRAAASPSLDGDALVLDVPADAASGQLGGWLVLPDLGVRVPWTATIRDAAKATVPLRADLTSPTLRPAIGPGAFASTLRLSIGGGDGSKTDSLSLAAVQKLELRLVDPAGKDRGLVGGLDTALPGIYDFGLTGVGPDGAALKPGAWEIHVRYVPASDPAGEWRSGPVAKVAVPKS